MNACRASSKEDMPENSACSEGPRRLRQKQAPEEGSAAVAPTPAPPRTCGQIQQDRRDHRREKLRNRGRQ